MGGWIAYGYGVYYGYYGDRRYGGTGIWAMDPERPGVHQRLSALSGEPVAWSSDGSKLLIIRQSGHGRLVADQALYVLNADGSETLLVDAGCSYCLSGGSFSSDGSEVVYGNTTPDGASRGIYVVDAAGSTPRRLPAAGQDPGGAVFSPDGSQIAYFAGGGDHDNAIWLMNADGSRSHALLWDTPVMRNSRGPGYLGWSPDGRHLVFGIAHGPWSIYVVRTDGSGLTRVIAQGIHPEWSPDGSRITYDSYLSRLAQVGPMMIADADGTHVQRFDGAGSGPWNPLPRADQGTTATSGTSSVDKGAVRNGQLDPGTYTYFDVDGGGFGFNVRFTVPAGWIWHGRYLSKGGVAPPGGAAIFFFGGPVQVYADPCHWVGARPDPPTGLSVVDLMAALAAQSMRTAGTPIDRNASVPNWNSATPASIYNRWPGMAVELTVPDDINFADCDRGQFRSWGPQSNARSNQGPGQRDLVWAVDVLGNGVEYGGPGEREQRLIVDAASFPGTPADVTAEIQAILASVAVGHWG